MGRRAALVIALSGCGFVGHGTSDDHVPIDAAPPTADAAFSLDDCPLTYKTYHEHRYRRINVAAYAWKAAETCATDLRGATHLVAIDDAEEMGYVEGFVNADQANGTRFWVGGVQRLDATARNAGWLSITGGDLPKIWQLQEPSDDNPPYAGENHVEQFVRIDLNSYGFVDAPGKLDGHSYVCECDGKPISIEAQTAIDMNAAHEN